MQLEERLGLWPPLPFSRTHDPYVCSPELCNLAVFRVPITSDDPGAAGRAESGKGKNKTVTTDITDPGPDPVTGIDPWPSLINAINNQKISSQNQCDQANASLKAIFDRAWGGFITRVNAGQAAGAGNPGCKPPSAPASYVLSAPDAVGFQWPVQAGPPVVDLNDGNHVIPEDHSLTSQQLAGKIGPNVPDVGHWLNGNWYSAGPGNTFSNTSTPDQKTPPITLPAIAGGPAADGLPHIFQFIQGAVQNSGVGIILGWYLLVG